MKPWKAALAVAFVSSAVTATAVMALQEYPVVVATPWRDEVTNSVVPGTYAARLLLGSPRGPSVLIKAWLDEKSEGGAWCAGRRDRTGGAKN